MKKLLEIGKVLNKQQKRKIIGGSDNPPCAGEGPYMYQMTCASGQVICCKGVAGAQVAPDAVQCYILPFMTLLTVYCGGGSEEA